MRIPARSPHAVLALQLVESLQSRFVRRLEALSRETNEDAHRPFTVIEWLRDEGRHGGGERHATAGTPMFDGASINVSQVQYDDDPSKRLASATALSAIIHPNHSHAPSIHMHISWTEMRDASGYFRIMADLNPAIAYPSDTTKFESALRCAAPVSFDHARAQGDRYFYIPALGRHRGVSHFYLEGYATGDVAADAGLARAVAEATIDVYTEILTQAIGRTEREGDRARQLAYHTLYMFQVLTLDRGTTSGLLVHDQNDVGILGSLPSHIDRSLLSSWIPKLPAPQPDLLTAIVDALPETTPVAITDPLKRTLAAIVRAHYRAHPQALELQASADVIPPTIANHTATVGS